MKKNKFKITLILLFLIWNVSCDNLIDNNTIIDSDDTIEESEFTVVDVHGAGAQRSDPKSGDPDLFPEGHGPQGDVIRILNYVRPVRSVSSTSVSYPIVDTGQLLYFNNTTYISYPDLTSDFYGQDSNYTNLESSYTDNNNGTITDNNTGLMWQQDPGSKMTKYNAEIGVSSFTLGGFDDWRIPTVKELYSLILFSGRDVSVAMNDSDYPEIPFIDTIFFTFEYGDEDTGERNIDAQYLSSTEYVSTTMQGDATVFGVNFADGRIKGYPITKADGIGNEFFVIYVRGNTSYGENKFIDNLDGTVSDSATGLMWLQDDSNIGMDWDKSLQWCESLNEANYSDWRLPNAKELQSIVDYTRSFDTTNSSAIDPIFNSTIIEVEDGSNNFPFYWTSTTHADCYDNANYAVYLAFGEALGFMNFGE